MEMSSDKLLSIIVPAYNSQDYICRCLDTVVQGGTEVEVIVVDDGSTDQTAEIAQKYVTQFPNIVRLEQKENGGHGSAVNRGLEVAIGLYVKVVDSDDRLEPAEYMKVLSALRENDQIDLLITNYVYDYTYNGTQKVAQFKNMFPQRIPISWDQMKDFRMDQLLMMHALYYRTSFLRQSGLKLPEHTFYVDNLVAYLPLPHVKSLMYIECSPYHYTIGRDGQSVSKQAMLRQMDQQLKVTGLMIEAYDIQRDLKSEKLKKYMLHYLTLMMAITMTYIYISKDSELKRKADIFWEMIQQQDSALYAVLQRNRLLVLINLGSRISPGLLSFGFKLVTRIYKIS